MTGLRLRHVAEINPATPEFDDLADEDEVSFVPLERVWPSEFDPSELRAKSAVSVGYTRFRDGDIIVPKITPTFQADRTLIASGLHGGVAAGTTELHVVRPSAGIDTGYVRYLLSSLPFLQGGVAEMIGVAGQKRVPDDWLRDLSVPISYVGQQRRIADFLDAETARIDALISAKQRMIDTGWERHVAFINDRLIRDGVSRVPFRRLMASAPIYGASESGESDPEDAAWPRYIRITDITPEGRLHEDGRKFLSPEAAHGFVLGDLDLLFARSGATVGKSFLYRSEDGLCAFAGYLIRVRVSPTLIDPRLLIHWTQSADYWEQIRITALQSTIENVSAERYKELRVPVPPQAEQLEIIAQLDLSRSRTDSVALGLNRQIELLRERRRALITAAVTGELAV